MVEQRGNPTIEQFEDFIVAGYSDRDVLEIVLAIAVKTISNYSNHVVHTKVDGAFQAYAWESRTVATV